MLLLFLVVIVGPPIFKESLSTVVFDTDGELLSARVTTDEQWRFPLSDSVPHRFRQCITNFEDAYFDAHLGVNPVSLVRAAISNIREKRIVSGGSTISMQVIRLNRKGQTRTISEKLTEIWLASVMEIHWTKDEIINYYCSYAPFGGNVVGLEAASWRYYGRPSYQLSWGESASLAVLPNAPSIIYPGKSELIYLKKRNALLDKLYRNDIIDSTANSLAKSESLPSRPLPLPDIAPHLLLTSAKNGFAGKIIHSSLERALQVELTNILNQYHEINHQNEIHNGAILVVNNKSNKIMAYVGNTNCTRPDGGAWVDIIVSQRSTGSLLKPFLYASAIDEGRITTHSLIPDIPTKIAGFTPKNFDKKYSGAAPAGEALTKSLNIPAVRLLRDYGLDKFGQKIQDLGFSSINKGVDHYGLSIILGGAESNLMELCAAYSGLASICNSGNNNIKLRYALPDIENSIETDHVTKEAPLSAGSVYIILDLLTEVKRPYTQGEWKKFESSRTIGWKTGTSYGFRDAWAIGVTPEYTVGVWIGNASGEGRPQLIGLESAAPVMFDVFDHLPETSWFIKPNDDIVNLSVCLQSGDLIGPYCTDTLEIMHPFYGRNNLQSCPYHSMVHLDSTRNYQVNSTCYSVAAMIDISWFVLPPTIESYFIKHAPNYRRLPPYLVQCDFNDENIIEIIYPTDNTIVRIPKNLGGEIGNVIFEAAHQLTETVLYWHLDDEFIGSTIGIHKIEFLPNIGQHTLYILDENGNDISIRFEVLEA